MDKKAFKSMLYWCASLLGFFMVLHFKKGEYLEIAELFVIGIVFWCLHDAVQLDDNN